MRKIKNIIVGVIIVIVVIISVCLFNRPKLLGNMGNNYTKETTVTSDISFSGEANEKIKFSFQSDIESGDLDMFLYDSAENEVYKLDRAKELESFFILNNSDNYTLAAKCKNFIGKYKIKVYKVK